MKRGSTIRKEIDWLSDEYENGDYEGIAGNVTAFICAEKDVLDDCTPEESVRYQAHKEKLMRPHKQGEV